MFRKENVYAVVQAFGVRVKDERQQDRNHLVEVGFEVALTYDMADEILPAMARDLYLSVKGEMHPRPEMTEATFALSPPPQIMECRNHPDLAAEVRVEGVTLRKIKAVKSDGGTWALRFLANWTLGRPEEVTLMIQRLKLGVYLSFQEQQPALPVEGVVDTTATPVAEDKPKGRKRRKQTPEAEGQAQLSEGRKLLEAGERFGKDDDAATGDGDTPAEAADEAPADAGESDGTPTGADDAAAADADGPL